MNFLKNKVLFRCDAGYESELGSGHLFRCLTIAKYLQVFNGIKSNEILFIIKTGKKFENSIKILKNFSFKVCKIERDIKNYSRQEIDILKNFKADLIIIDRLGKVKKKFIINALKNFRRKVIIDDSSINRKLFDVSLNPLITNVSKFKNSNIGKNYFISPVFFYKEKYFKNFNRGIFLYLGVTNNNLQIKKILFKISRTTNLPIYLPIIYLKKLKNVKIENKVIFYKIDEFYKYMYNSKFVIISGGMSFFDAMYFNKNIICLPQYRHQENNINNYKNLSNVKIISTKKGNFEKKFAKVMNYFTKKDTGYKKATKKIYKKKMKFTLNKISHLI